jgi:hypothetical protein
MTFFLCWFPVFQQNLLWTPTGARSVSAMNSDMGSVRQRTHFRDGCMHERHLIKYFHCHSDTSGLPAITGIRCSPIRYTSSLYATHELTHLQLQHKDISCTLPAMTDLRMKVHCAMVDSTSGFSVKHDHLMD